MDWQMQYDPQQQPSCQQMGQWIQNSLWQEFCHTIETQYAIAPHFSYSKCSMMPGWNIKYKKSGKALCTLYPQKGYFYCLLVIGNKEQPEADLLLPTLSPAMQELYRNTPNKNGRWLLIPIANRTMMQDAEKLIALRTTKKNR